MKKPYIKPYTKFEAYTVGQFEDDECYYVFKWNVPIIHFDSEKTANSVAILLNKEYGKTKRAEDNIKTLLEYDENRKEYQRMLESKIRRLKERIRMLEK